MESGFHQASNVPRSFMEIEDLLWKSDLVQMWPPAGEVRIWTGSWRIRERIISPSSWCPLASSWSQSLREICEKLSIFYQQTGTMKGQLKEMPMESFYLCVAAVSEVHSQQCEVGWSRGCSLHEWKFTLLSPCWLGHCVYHPNGQRQVLLRKGADVHPQNRSSCPPHH